MAFQESRHWRRHGTPPIRRSNINHVIGRNVDICRQIRTITRPNFFLLPVLPPHHNLRDKPLPAKFQRASLSSFRRLFLQFSACLRNGVIHHQAILFHKYLLFTKDCHCLFHIINNFDTEGTPLLTGSAACAFRRNLFQCAVMLPYCFWNRPLCLCQI